MNDRETGSKSQHADFLLVGGGLANASAAETLREGDAPGSVVILSAESLPPYNRPPLSKGFLLGRVDAAKILVHPENYYRDHSIELRLNCRALSVDTSRRIVTTTDGEISYDQLMIATGGIPKALRVPGAQLSGVFHLNSEGDAKAIRSAAAEARRAIVVGGSFLGMEIAMSLRQLGLDVTLIERRPLILPYLEARDLSDYFKSYAESHGVRILLDDSIEMFRGGGKVQQAETIQGHSLPCDLAVVAIGISPASEFLAGSGVELDEGYIVVDDRLRTSVPNVYAAGDVTSFYDPVFARRRHIEHWDNAVKQGRLAAYNMLGRRTRYDEISYFFFDLGDVSFAMLGAPEEGHERIARGCLDERSYALFYLKNNIMRAIFSTGRPSEETRSAEGLIRYRTNLNAVKKRLSDPAFALDKIPAQTALILQGGGALGAFECGVVKALEEEKIFPDIVAGVSIGALNGAIIAGNPRNATQALEAFWAEIAVGTPPLGLLPAVLSGGEKAAIAMQILAFGVPKLFKPRWVLPFGDFASSPMNWTSFYDPSPMRALIAKYVDFAALKASPVRLLISAVNVATAELEVFDSYVDDLTPDHIMASCSLPPGFPWTVIDGKPYWDGGIVSNSPLDLILDRGGPGGKRIFAVDLFLGQRTLPSNMMEVVARRDEIVYAERVRSNLHYREMSSAFRELIASILGRIDRTEAAKIKHWPKYIQLMGDDASGKVIRIVRPAHEGEQPSRDYDFSDVAICSLQREGYEIAKQVLSRR